MRALTQAVARAERVPPDAAAGLLRPLLEDIGWLDALLDKDCAAMVDDPLHLPAFRASRSGAVRHLVLARTERIWVAATIVDQRAAASAATRIHFSGRRLLCRVLGPRAARASGWRIEGGRAVPTGERLLKSGSLFELDERQETVRLCTRDGPVLLLRAVIAPPGPVVARLFDAATGAPSACAQIDEGHARALMMLSLLRLQGRTDAAPLFEAALDLPLPEQRWAVMREYLALDPRAALPTLEIMARREPGEVGRLARATLEQVGGMPCPA